MIRLGEIPMVTDEDLAFQAAELGRRQKELLDLQVFEQQYTQAVIDRANAEAAERRQSSTVRALTFSGVVLAAGLGTVMVGILLSRSRRRT